MKFVLVILISLIAIVNGYGQSTMTDADFVGLKDKVKSIVTERTFTFAKNSTQVLNKTQLIKSNYYDKKGFLTQSSSFDNGESRRMHTFVRNDRMVKRFEFDAMGAPLAVKGLCPPARIQNSKDVDSNFDYFYSYERDTLKRIIGATEYCDASLILTRSSFKYNDRNNVISDVRCQPLVNICDTNTYEYVNGRLMEQRVGTAVNGVETCTSMTTYSEHQFDKKGNEIRRVGVTTDCSPNRNVFFRFIDTTRVDYY